MQVDQFHHGEAGGVPCLRRRAQSFFVLLPVGLGSGQGMVAVPHRKQRGIVSQPGLKRLQRLCQMAEFRLPGDPPAPDMPAVHQKGQVVKEGQRLPPVIQRPDQAVLLVIHQQQNMGQLQGGPLPQLQPGRDALQHRLLRGADQGAAALLIVILLQVNGCHQADAPARLGAALHQNEALRQFHQQALLQIIPHRLLRLLADGLRLLQKGLRDDQAQGGGMPADFLLHRPPHLRLGGVLITGDHRPEAVQVLLPRQQEGGGRDAQAAPINHGVSPPCFLLRMIPGKGRKDCCCVFRQNNEKCPALSR